MDEIRNIFAGSVLIFYQLETLLNEIFPFPPCMVFSFNLPSNMRSIIYKEYPRVLALFLNQQLKIKTNCVFLRHNSSSEQIPAQLKNILLRFLQPFLMKFESQTGNGKVKRNANPLINFFQYIFTDQDQRVQSLEGNQKLEISVINKNLKQDEKITFSVNSNTKEIQQIFSNLENKKNIS